MEFAEIIADVDAEQLRWEEDVTTHRGGCAMPQEPSPDSVGRIGQQPVDTTYWSRNLRPYDGEPQMYQHFFDDICRAWEDALASLE